jgi:hypothetical protein
MVNAWSLLYDELYMIEHSEHYYEYDRDDPNKKSPFEEIHSATKSDWEDFWSDIHEKHEFTLTMNQDPNRYKYSEDEILKELRDYISGTYNAHYSSGDDKIQTLDLIEACGDGESFCRSNILKYASRYDKKGTARRDIMKILHYAVLLMHFNDKNAKRETYPQ